MNVTSAPASTTISVCGNTAAPSASTYVNVCSGRSTFVSRGTYRNVPPVRNAACIAVKRVRSDRHEVVQVPLDQVGMLGRRLVEVAEPDTLVDEPGRPLGRDHLRVQLDLEPGALTTTGGGEHPMAAHVLGSAAAREGDVVQLEPRQIRVAPLLGGLGGHRQAREGVERLLPELPREARHLGQRGQGQFVEGGACRDVAHLRFVSMREGRPFGPALSAHQALGSGLGSEDSFGWVGLSRPSPPSAARSGGSARPRTPSAARG